MHIPEIINIKTSPNTENIIQYTITMFTLSPSSPPPSIFGSKFPIQPPRTRFPATFSSTQSESVGGSIVQVDAKPVSVYNPGPLDDLFLNLFRKKMVQETGWDSDKPGYDGLIEVSNKLMLGRTSSDVNDATVRILRSLFPPFLLDLYRLLITPVGGGQLAAVMVGGSPVYVERCKYLEESKCVGVCINTCKIPTQTFFKDYMGIPLLMEPKFSDYSCQFNFGILPPPREDDNALKESCLEICPSVAKRKGTSRESDYNRCPKS
ncbi:hypothetical protein V2J09_023727 [Rumex salicifolius]